MHKIDRKEIEDLRRECAEQIPHKHGEFGESCKYHENFEDREEGCRGEGFGPSEELYVCQRVVHIIDNWLVTGSCYDAER